MFDFQKLSVYQKAKTINQDIILLLSENDFDRHVKDQLKRASFSIMLNIAEGSSRFSNKDRRYFMIIARGSAFECVAIFDFLKDSSMVSSEQYDLFTSKYEEISKMLYSLIRKLEK